MSTQLTPSTSPLAYHIRVATEKDIGPITENLRKNFFRDEPLLKYIKFVENENDTCAELENICIKYINSISVLAVTEDGKIIGASLNGILERNRIENTPEIENPKYAKIAKFLDIAYTQADVFGRLPEVQKVMTIKFLSVDSAARKLGIAQKLMDKTIEIARQQGCDLMRVGGTSNFTARAIAKFGFECFYTLKYEEYLENGVPVFIPEEPHKQFVIYVQKM